MKRMGGSRALAVLIAAGLIACGRPQGGGSEAAIIAADSTVLVGGTVPGALPDNGSAGARLVSRYCARCHAVPSPARHSAAEWPSTLRRMYLRMDHMAVMGGMMRGGGRGRGMMGGGRAGAIAVPSAAERDTILAYLRGHALKELAEDSLPRAGTGQAEVFRTACSRCHALPDPAQHSPDEWPAVVRRMRQHMREMNVGDVSDGEAHEIVTYLQAASGT